MIIFGRRSFRLELIACLPPGFAISLDVCTTAEDISLSTVILATLNKLSYCWETVRRESMPRIAEMDVEMTT